MISHRGMWGSSLGDRSVNRTSRPMVGGEGLEPPTSSV
jgi:hypothetical protein